MYPTDLPSPPAGPDTAAAPELSAPPRRRGRRGLKIAAVVLGTVLLVGVPSAVALVLALNRGGGDELVSMVPANTDVYVTALLDPPLSQKRDLQSVLERFPQLNSDSKLQKQFNSAMQNAFSSSGLDWKKDVQPWLGSQIAGFFDFSGSKMAGGMLLRTTDEHATLAAMDALKSGPGTRSEHWHTGQHGGVTVWNASNSHSSDDGGYAVFDHTLVIGSDNATIDAMIDAGQGRTANLGSSASYKQTLQDLPAEHLGVVYVNAASAIGALKKAMGPIDSGNEPQVVQQALADLDAYQSLGMSLSLEPSAVDLDTVTLTDPNRLSVATRQALDKPAARSRMLNWVPGDSFVVLTSSPGAASVGSALPVAAVLGVVGLTVVGKQVNNTFSNVSDGLSATPPPGLSDGTVPPDVAPPPDSGPSSDQMNQIMQQLGLTGPDGIAGHLTGESALFVDPGAGRGTTPVSAVAVIGTDDPARMETLLHNVGDLLGSGAGGDGQALPWLVRKDGAVDIHYLDMSSTAGVLPAYAVVDGYAVVGTDPNAVQNAIDAHRGVQGNVSTAPAFRGSPAGNATGGVFFVDFQRVLSVIENNMYGSDRADFDNNVKPDLAPLRTFVVTSGGDDRHQTSHMVLTLG